MGADKKSHLLAHVFLTEALVRGLVIDKYKDNGLEDYRKMRDTYMNTFRYFGAVPDAMPQTDKAKAQKDFADQLVIAAERFFDTVEKEINSKADDDPDPAE